MTRTYIYLLRPITPGIPSQILPYHEALMDEHFARLQQSLRDGSLLLAGPCEDETFGIVVFRAKSMGDAQQFMNDNPAVRGGLMTAKLHPFHVSLLNVSDWPASGIRQ